MKKSKVNYLIVALVVILLTIAVGYAAFSQQFQITGTAAAKGNWNIHFANAKIEPSDSKNSVTLSEDNSKMTVNVNLEKPGDIRIAEVHILNEGSVDATLTAFNIEAKNGEKQTITPEGGVAYINGAIRMTLEQIQVGSDLVATTGDKTYLMSFEWPDNYVEENVDDSTTFTVTFDYSQKN